MFLLGYLLRCRGFLVLEMKTLLGLEALGVTKLHCWVCPAIDLGWLVS